MNLGLDTYDHRVNLNDIIAEVDEFKEVKSRIKKSEFTEDQYAKVSETIDTYSKNEGKDTISEQDDKKPVEVDDTRMSRIDIDYSDIVKEILSKVEGVPNTGTFGNLVNHIIKFRENRDNYNLYGKFGKDEQESKYLIQLAYDIHDLVLNIYACIEHANIDYRMDRKGNVYFMGSNNPKYRLLFKYIIDSAFSLTLATVMEESIPAYKNNYNFMNSELYVLSPSDRFMGYIPDTYGMYKELAEQFIVKNCKNDAYTDDIKECLITFIRLLTSYSRYYVFAMFLMSNDGTMLTGKELTQRLYAIDYTLSLGAQDPVTTYLQQIITRSKHLSTRDAEKEIKKLMESNAIIESIRGGYILRDIRRCFDV